MKKRAIIITLIISIVLAFAGCNNKNNEVHEVNKKVEKTAKDYEERLDEQEQETEDDKKTSEVTKLTVCYINLLNVDMGMIGMIDPVTMQQINVDALPSGQMITTEINVPIENREIKWAIYNNDGELYSESTTDTSNAENFVCIILKGDKNVDGIDTLIDPSDEEIEEAMQ